MTRRSAEYQRMAQLEAAAHLRAAYKRVSEALVPIPMPGTSKFGDAPMVVDNPPDPRYSELVQAMHQLHMAVAAMTVLAKSP